MNEHEVRALINKII